jgi:hypothetical protein
MLMKIQFFWNVTPCRRHIITDVFEERVSSKFRVCKSFLIFWSDSSRLGFYTV